MPGCGECGFDWDRTEPSDLVDQFRLFRQRYRIPLTRFLPGEDSEVVLRKRPESSVWSALEYVAHTRDALEWYAERIERVLAEDRPPLMPFDFETACTERRYNDEDSAAVVEELAKSSEALADRLAHIDGATWERVGVGSDGGDRTVLVLARRAVHEGRHHLLDVGRVLRRVRGRS